MRRAALAIAATALLLAARGAAAEECVIVGGPQAPLLVRIYESDPYGAPAGKRLYIGLLNRGEKQRIKSQHGTIWYAFKWHEGDTWREGYEAPCAGGHEVVLPGQ
jgi:hypothetical protein